MSPLNKLIITSFGAHLFPGNSEKASLPGKKIMLYLRDQKAFGIEIFREEGDLTGSIHLGRVKNILRNINGAFLDILDYSGHVIPCFYPFPPEGGKKNEEAPLREGDSLLVQVIKDRIKSKAPIVSRSISLRGTYVVLTLNKEGLSFSSKWIGKKSKENLRRVLAEEMRELSEIQEITKPGASTEAKKMSIGITLRTAAQQGSPSAIKKELRYLKKEMERILQLRDYRKAPVLLKRAEAGYLEVLRKISPWQLEEIITDDEEVYKNIASYFETADSFPAALRLYKDSRLPLHKLYRIGTLLSEALGSRVWLKSGGYIVIEVTEALTSIDVNTGKNIKGMDPARTIRETNKEAAEEISRQLRLRNLSGIILIDFIDMKKREDREEILLLMRKRAAEDPVKVQVLDFTRLCLLEMTRQRIKGTLKEQMSEKSV